MPKTNAELAEIARTLKSDVNIADESNILYKTALLVKSGRKASLRNPLIIAIRLADTLLGRVTIGSVAFTTLSPEAQFNIAKAFHLYLELSISLCQKNPRKIYEGITERYKDCIAVLQGIIDKSDTRIVYELDGVKECLNLLDTDAQELVDFAKAIADLVKGAVSLKPKLGKVLPYLAKQWKKMSHLWYADVWLIRQLSRVALTSKTDLSELQQFIQTKQQSNWHVVYSGVDALADVIKYSKDSGIRQQALKGIEDQETQLPGLIGFAHSKDWRIRYKAVEVLLELHEHPDTIVRESAQRGLKEVEEVEEKDNRVRQLMERLRASAALRRNWLDWKPSLKDQITQIGNQILRDKTVYEEQKLYIPTNGSRDIIGQQDVFDLEQEVNRFITSEKKVLLLLGNAGAGKSMFCQYLLVKLWRNYSERLPVPLYIYLPSLKDPVRNLVKETFESYGFSGKQISSLKKQQSFIFVLDGYDEIGTNENLYVENKLKEWKIKIIIGCRTQYLADKGDYHARFMPYHNETRQHTLFDEMTVVPFSDKQIDSYIQKYLENDQHTAWRDWKRYRECIDLLPGLRSLIETPFLLRITMEALPGIDSRYKTLSPKKRRLLTESDLYDAFMTKWFEREEDKLVVLGKLPKTGQDIKRDFWKFAEQLAVEMYLAGVSVIAYERWEDLFGTKTISQWTKFFDFINERTVLACKACPLRRLNNYQYTFIHDSLREYFASRTMSKSKLSLPTSSHLSHCTHGFFASSTTTSTVPSSPTTISIVPSPQLSEQDDEPEIKEREDNEESEVAEEKAITERIF